MERNDQGHFNRLEWRKQCVGGIKRLLSGSTSLIISLSLNK